MSFITKLFTHVLIYRKLLLYVLLFDLVNATFEFTESSLPNILVAFEFSGCTDILEEGGSGLTRINPKNIELNIACLLEHEYHNGMTPQYFLYQNYDQTCSHIPENNVSTYILKHSKIISSIDNFFNRLVISSQFSAEDYEYVEENDVRKRIFILMPIYGLDMKHHWCHFLEPTQNVLKINTDHSTYHYKAFEFFLEDKKLVNGRILIEDFEKIVNLFHGDLKDSISFLHDDNSIKPDTSRIFLYPFIFNKTNKPFPLKSEALSFNTHSTPKDTPIQNDDICVMTESNPSVESDQNVSNRTTAILTGLNVIFFNLQKCETSMYQRLNPVCTNIENSEMDEAKNELSWLVSCINQTEMPFLQHVLAYSNSKNQQQYAFLKIQAAIRQYEHNIEKTHRIISQRVQDVIYCISERKNMVEHEIDHMIQVICSDNPNSFTENWIQDLYIYHEEIRKNIQDQFSFAKNQICRIHEASLGQKPRYHMNKFEESNLLELTRAFQYISRLEMSSNFEKLLSKYTSGLALSKTCERQIQCTIKMYNSLSLSIGESHASEVNNEQSSNNIPNMGDEETSYIRNQFILLKKYIVAMHESFNSNFKIILVDIIKKEELLKKRTTFLNNIDLIIKKSNINMHKKRKAALNVLDAIKFDTMAKLNVLHEKIKLLGNPPLYL